MKHADKRRTIILEFNDDKFYNLNSKRPKNVTLTVMVRLT